MKSKRGRSGPDPIDVHVGSRIRARRVLLGLSQEKLADGLGITFQQVQKYERGTNRVSASRLYKIASLLDVTVSFFFEDVEEVAGADGAKAIAPARMPEASEFPEDLMVRKETLNLLRYYYSIPDANLRQRFIDLLRGVTKSELIG